MPPSLSDATYMGLPFIQGATFMMYCNVDTMLLVSLSLFSKFNTFWSSKNKKDLTRKTYSYLHAINWCLLPLYMVYHNEEIEKAYIAIYTDIRLHISHIRKHIKTSVITDWSA